MDKKYTKTRLIALLSAFIFVFTLVLSGCSAVKKIEKSEKNSDGDGLINIGQGNGDIPDDYQVVVGSDGQSYLVDGEGNSVLYNATSAYIDPNSLSTSSTNTTPGNKTDTSNSPTNPTNPVNPTNPTHSEPSSDTTAITDFQSSPVYNAYAVQRRFGFNKAYDTLSGLANFYLDTIRVYFHYNNKDWLVEFWKGEYAMASVGCEIGLYYRDCDGKHENGVLDKASGADRKHYTCVDDEDAIYMSMELWQYVKSTDAEPAKKLTFGRRLCWWAAQFENGVLEKHSDRTSLVMRGSVEFPTYEMTELFVEGLESRGFREGSTSTYKNVERFSVDGKKVTVNWRYYDEDRFQYGS